MRGTTTTRYTLPLLLLLLPLLLLLFFFFLCLLFWPSEMEKRCRRRVAKCCGIGENCSSFTSGNKKREPRAPDFQPRTTSFWVGLLFLKKSKHLKTTSFWGLDFFKKKKRHPKQHCFGLPATKTMSFCVSGP